MKIASDERRTLADLLDAFGPDAPTLCEGWTTGDLAAHLVVRENDPIAAGGIMIAPLAGHTERKMAEVLTRPWPEVVGKVRSGPTGFSFFRLPGVDEAANATEFFIHTEDIRRAQPGDHGPRAIPAEVEDFFWKRLRLMAKAMLRRSDVGVVLERTDRDDDAMRVRPGAQTVTVLGRPTELLLYVSGRADHAEVELVGDANAIARLSPA